MFSHSAHYEHLTPSARGCQVIQLQPSSLLEYFHIHTNCMQSPTTPISYSDCVVWRCLLGLVVSVPTMPQTFMVFLYLLAIPFGIAQEATQLNWLVGHWQRAAAS